MVSGDIGLPNKRDEFHGEQLVFEERTSDPASTSEGEMWLRTDLAPKTDQIGTLRFDNGSGTWDIPIFSAGTSGANVEEVLRIPVGGTVGYVPILQSSPTFPQLGFQHAGARYGLYSRTSAIRDTSMFQSPIYQWTAVGLGLSQGDTVDPFVDELSSVSASAVNSPTFESDQSGLEAVGYQSGDTDHHTIPSDGQLPTGGNPVSVAATVYLPSGADGCLFGYGNSTQDQSVELQLHTNGDGTGFIRVETWKGSIRAISSNYFEGQWLTVGGWISDANGGQTFLNGSPAGSDSNGTLNQQDANRAIGYRTWSNNLPIDAYLHDLVVCASEESDQAFADYHNDRLG